MPVLTLRRRPDRWLPPNTISPSAKQIPGIYSYTMTFLGGPRGCIGYKFAVLEYVSSRRSLSLF